MDIQTLAHPSLDPLMVVCRHNLCTPARMFVTVYRAILVPLAGVDVTVMLDTFKGELMYAGRGLESNNFGFNGCIKYSPPNPKVIFIAYTFRAGTDVVSRKISGCKNMILKHC